MKLKNLILSILALAAVSSSVAVPTAMQNVMGREKQSLNGKWAVITDIMKLGDRQKWGDPKPAVDNLTLKELYYDGGMTLDVPGDWNSQRLEFFYYEAPMWYKKSFYFTPDDTKRNFLHFAGVSSKAEVYLNGKLLGKHSGGFTPFQFEVSDVLREGENVVVVRVDNIRTTDGIPALDFDWWNYGGITHDVDLISTPKTF
ncbi:MAG: sugar-binding domain-containing protein, partial [Rikenellaceae bacterium]